MDPVLRRTSLTYNGCRISHHIGAIVDGGVEVGARAGSLELVVGRTASPSRQLNRDIHIVEALSTIGVCIDHAFTLAVHAAVTPDTEVLLACLGVGCVVFVRHLDAATNHLTWCVTDGCECIVCQSASREVVLGGIIAHPTAIQRVV